MKEFQFLKLQKRKEIIKEIKKNLAQEKNIVFAYIFGSFLDPYNFRDIDIGIYLFKADKDKTFDYEVEFSDKIAKAIKFPFDLIDIKILNFTPLLVLNNIFRQGKLLFSKDDKLLTDLIEQSSLQTALNEHISIQSLRELG